MIRPPSASVLEAHARELQRTWLTGKVYPTWTLPILRENIPSAQVIQLIFFQVESRLLQNMQELSYWDWQDGQLSTWIGYFFSQAQNKIAISHVQLAPLLYNAIYHTLHIVLKPKETLAQFFFGQRTTLLQEEFAFYARYISYFEFIPAALLSYAQKHALATIDKTLWEAKVPRILEVYEEETQESLETYQKRLLQELTQQNWEKIQAHWQRLSQESEDLIGSVLEDDTKESDTLLKNLFGTSPESEPAQPQSTRARNPLLSAVDYEPRQVISQRFSSTPRRADTLRRFDLEHIPIHKQFVFIQRVFDGDPVAFREAIERLNTTHSLEEAQALLTTWQTPKTDPQAFQEFEKWVLSRFQS